ncbi:hypothetical protein IU450_36175 [Nocardia abscessus]|uniref:hypothetical protein n=1 Tax=Nocardia abscessus TaxID=120957 RepID=UPI001894261D|nr:hypothetical protein [Nocardia abscessus]MBF6341280.1 hypothetical protein [Nocardia abscessus]
MADDGATVTLDSAAAVVTVIEDVVRTQRFCADQFGDTHAVSHIAAGRLIRQAPPPSRTLLPPAERNHVLQTAAVGIRWQRGSRIACLVDPTLAAECADATAEAMPTDIVAQLPYRDPLVVFADPIPCRTTDDRPARLLGYFLYGLHGIADDRDGMLCSTHDDPDYLGITTVLETLDNSGVGPEVNRFLMTLRTDRVDIAEFLDSCIANWSADAVTAARCSEASIRSCLQQVLRPVLGSLLYLCSKEPDLTDPRPDADTRRTRKRRAAKPGRNRHTTTFIAVGWRLGANLRRLRRAATDPARPRTGTGTGRTQLPRQRASHFKVVWTGAGRAIPRLVFVMPYWIHKDQIDFDTTASTLVPTSPRRRRSRRTPSR